MFCKKIEKSFGEFVLFSDISFILEDTEKAAIVGVNGAGKTTLFKILTGQIPYDDGEIYIHDSKRIGYLSQTASLNPDNTIYNELLSTFSDLMEIENAMRTMENEMAHLSGDKLERAMVKYVELTHSFESRNGYECDSRVNGIIKGLGFIKSENLLVSSLSGGQKTRVSLGKLLLSTPDILFLDEPTNHLDIDAIEWLENYLSSYQGSVLIISHDRYFIDKVATKVIEIENKKSTVYSGNYTFFANQKITDREIQTKHYNLQQKEIHRQEEMIARYRSYATVKMVRKAKIKERQLEKMEHVDKPTALPDTMRLHVNKKRESGNDVLDIIQVSKSFDSHKLFGNIDISIKKGEKVALIGENGIGKSTLFRIVQREHAPDTGSIRFGANVQVGYYDQEHLNIDDSKTIFNELSDSFPRLTNGEIRNILASFVFTGDDVFKPISALSGGEKGRVSLAKLSLGGANFLLLDEPTNHLDLFSKEVLEKFVRNYEGTVFYISHDRYFINNTATRVLELTNQGVTEYLGNYDYYLDKKSKISEAANQSTLFKQNKEQPKNEWMAEKAAQSDERKRANRLKTIEEEIENCEKELAECENELSKDENAANADKLNELFGRQTELHERYDDLLTEWNSLTENQR